MTFWATPCHYVKCLLTLRFCDFGPLDFVSHLTLEDLREPLNMFLFTLRALTFCKPLNVGPLALVLKGLSP